MGFLSIKSVKNRLYDYYFRHYLNNNLNDENLRNKQVVVYLPGGVENKYQLDQWIEPFKALNERTPLIVVTRDKRLFMRLKKQEVFPVYFLRELGDLISFYRRFDFPVILYLNNACPNFQSLIYSEGYHLHLNHGESEKESMHSNQSKAYDAVFCAGDRAVQRYEEALLNFDPSKYIKIGRPQLDFIRPYRLEKEPYQKVILYAPTWEGHTESMDYCSVDKYGTELIETLLQDPSYLVLYKPHPNMGARRSDVKKAHEKIIELIDRSSNGRYIPKEDINSVFTVVDFAFFDNSSVMIDYLHADKPGFFFEIKKDNKMRFLSQCFTAINNMKIERLINIMKENIEKDPNRGKRKEIKTFYLGDYDHMESTNRFINTIKDFINSRT